MKLTEKEIKSAKVGRHADADGLYLEVSKTGSKSWIFRYQINKKRRDMGLGSLTKVSATAAREKVADAIKLINRGIDPLDQRKAEAVTNASAKEEQGFKLKTFRDVALDYINIHSAEWKNAKHISQWRNTLETYVYPIFGDTPVAQIDERLVLKVLSPIWAEKTETASRIRNRIELVLNLAKSRKMFEGDNPARWKGNLEQELANPNKIKNEEHQPALPYKQLPEFMNELRKHNGTSALCLEFAILTATRSGTARGARWEHIDEENKTFSPSADIMKNRKAGFVIPLSDEAMHVLEKAKPFRNESGLIFSGSKNNVLSDMSLLQMIRGMNADRVKNNLPQWIDFVSKRPVVPHGFRASFSTWSGESVSPSYPDELAELALAHSVGSKTESAYRRTDKFNQRRSQMDDWGRYCLTL